MEENIKAETKLNEQNERYKNKKGDHYNAQKRKSPPSAYIKDFNV